MTRHDQRNPLPSDFDRQKRVGERIQKDLEGVGAPPEDLGGVRSTWLGGRAEEAVFLELEGAAIDDWHTGSPMYREGLEGMMRWLSERFPTYGWPTLVPADPAPGETVLERLARKLYEADADWRRSQGATAAAWDDLGPAASGGYLAMASMLIDEAEALDLEAPDAGS